MFTGHFGAAFAAKAVRSDLSLGGLFVAAQLPDIVFSVLVATGVERVRVHEGETGPGAVEMVSVPFSHSLPGTFVLAALAAVAFRLARGRRGASPAAMALVGAVVVSHWVLDVIVHDGDVPLAGGVRVGLGWTGATGFVLETVLTIAGIAALLVTSRPRNLTGGVALPVFGVALLVFGALVTLSPPPSDPVLLGLTNLAAYLVLAAAAEWIGRQWIPRKRSARSGSSA